MEKIASSQSSEQNVPAGSVGSDVSSALFEVGCTLPDLPKRLREALGSLAEARVVPHLDEIERVCSTSRSSFYRLWRSSIAESPSAFLRRVRAIHARRLLAYGMTRKKAAMAAGYTSVDQMRRYLRGKSQR